MAGSESTRLEAIVLAAGAGRRFGGRKLTAIFAGRPLVAGALDAAFAAPARGVILATDGDPDLAALARDHARGLGREDDLTIVVVTEAAEGMGASLRTAALALPADADGAFVFLGDMPCIPPEVPRALARALREGSDLAAPRVGDRRGHPVLFGRAHFEALRALSGDAGAQRVLAEAGARLKLVDTTDLGVLFDVDRPEDLA
ncbi:molybdopterin-guanine dinucleotide biosynthesis protein MobA [Caulobacter sp. Root655]|uniref:nucleotidyltransferase family protein n=1 Tax=Caulobacter sp. Root655 TaxID=1736578 RepID=UPI0006FB477C|nr:nucleotidyltransferase family protein [Caulobacter sp. Root655]KRA56159.1 molybdopterin-guanine dinucleotide biosynthesis protein MobA [Caulobacter sp. Root655]